LNPAEHWTRFVGRSPIGIVIDLDGPAIPLAPPAPGPDEGTPATESLDLLRELAGLPDVVVTVLSGRPRAVLDRLLGDVAGLRVAAEHGGWLRGEGGWRAPVSDDPAALDTLAGAVERILPPGAARLERTTWSLCLTFGDVPEPDRTRLVVEANVAIAAWLPGHPGYQRLESADRLEVRLARVRKSAAIAWTRARAGPSASLLVLGGARTDDDLFRSLTPVDEGLLVAPRTRAGTPARWTLSGPDRAVVFLRAVVAARRTGATLAVEALPHALARPSGPAPAAYRLLAISNRLPDLRSPTAPGTDRRRNVGGLVSALEPVLAARRGLWLGWSGRTGDAGEPGPVEIDDRSTPPLAWIDFPADWYERYYNGFCNQSLWPLCHTFPERVRFVDEEWQAYVKVNAAFAAAARTLVEPDVPVWVHDYHLLLAAGALRRLGHRGPLGLFLHVPFPGIDLFSMLPWVGGSSTTCCSSTCSASTPSATSTTSASACAASPPPASTTTGSPPVAGGYACARSRSASSRRDSRSRPRRGPPRRSPPCCSRLRPAGWCWA